MEIHAYRFSSSHHASQLALASRFIRSHTHTHESVMRSFRATARSRQGYGERMARTSMNLTQVAAQRDEQSAARIANELDREARWRAPAEEPDHAARHTPRSPDI